MLHGRRKKRRKRSKDRSAWPQSESYHGPIDLHMLPPVAAINGARIRALTGDDRIPDSAQISLRAFRAVVGERTFHVGPPQSVTASASVRLASP